MIETVQTNDGIDEPEFGYYARMEGYANLSSDMKELGETILKSQRMQDSLVFRKGSD